MSRAYADKVSAWRAGREHELIELVEELKDRVGPDRSLQGLDWGCNDGEVQTVLMKRFPKLNMIGLDANVHAVAAGRRKDRDVRLLAPGEQLPFPAGSLDLVTCIATLAHMPDPQFAVREMARVLRHGGLALIETPHPMYDMILAPWLSLKGYKGDETIIRKVHPWRLADMAAPYFEPFEEEPTGRRLPVLLRWMGVTSDYKVWMERS